MDTAERQSTANQAVAQASSRATPLTSDRRPTQTGRPAGRLAVANLAGFWLTVCTFQEVPRSIR